MSIENDFKTIFLYAHYRNWAPDWGVVYEIYAAFPNSFSVLTPFAYSYLEEVIRSMTSEYGQVSLDEAGKPKRKKVGYSLIELAIIENQDNPDLIKLLEKAKIHYQPSMPEDRGDNRNSVNHGYMHPRFWYKEDFDSLIHEIAALSEYAGF